MSVSGAGPSSSGPLALGALRYLGNDAPTPVALAFRFYLCSVSTSQLLPAPLSMVSEEQGPPGSVPRGRPPPRAHSRPCGFPSPAGHTCYPSAGPGCPSQPYRSLGTCNGGEGRGNSGAVGPWGGGNLE